MNVLIVDDRAAMRMMIIKTLRQAGLNGHEFSQATDGAAALEAIRKAPPDVVLCDWNMPNMTGIELLRAVRADAQLRHLPFLMITAEAKRENIIEAAQAGASGYIVKPFTAATLEEKLAKIFQSTSRQAG